MEILALLNRALRGFGLGRVAILLVTLLGAGICAWYGLFSDSSLQMADEPKTGQAASSQSADISQAKGQPRSPEPSESDGRVGGGNAEAQGKMAEDEGSSELKQALSSGSVDNQIEAIKLFARVGTPEQKALIVADAGNRQADVAVRVAAIENMDWNPHLDLVKQLIRSDPAVSEATLYIAAEKDLSPQSVATLADNVSAIFSSLSEPSSQLAALHFLLERDSGRFDSVAMQAPVSSYSPTEYQDFVQLMETRRQEEQFLNGSPN